MATKLFESFLDKVEEFPFWIKEVIYIKLREEFERACVGEKYLNTPIEESYQAYKPLLTYAGRKELSEHCNQEDERIYRFLQIANEESSIAEITLRNFWTLEDTAKIHTLCIQKEYVSKPTSAKVYAMALFIGSRIKIGDYFKRIGKITIDELDKTIRRQKELGVQGKNLRFAEVLVSLNYVTKEDTKAVIYIKEESKKRFIFNAGLLGKSTTTEASSRISLDSDFDNTNNNSKNSPQLVLLRQEVYELEQKMREIMQIIKR